MPIYNCSKNECVKERCPSISPYVCTDTSPGAPYGGCFTLEQANSLPNLNFCNSVVCDQYDYDIPSCNREVCMNHKCSDNDPYVCYTDSPLGRNWSCHSSKLSAKQGCNPRYASQQLCDASQCASPAPGPRPSPGSSYVCNNSSKNCESVPFPPDPFQNRYPSLELCEQQSKVCRKEPGPAPGPAPHKLCPSNCVIPVDSCYKFTASDAYHQLANCACGYESPGWTDPSMCELKNVGGTIYCGRSEEPRPPDSEDCDYLDRCNNRGRFIPGAGASGSCMGCSENTTGTFCDRCIQGTQCDQPQMGDLCPYPARCV